MEHEKKVCQKCIHHSNKPSYCGKWGKHVPRKWTCDSWKRSEK